MINHQILFGQVLKGRPNNAKNRVKWDKPEIESKNSLWGKNSNEKKLTTLMKIVQNKTQNKNRGHWKYSKEMGENYNLGDIVYEIIKYTAGNYKK